MRKYPFTIRTILSGLRNCKRHYRSAEEEISGWVALDSAYCSAGVVHWNSARSRTATSRTTSAGGTRVTYLVTGPGTVGLTFKNESGGTEQRTVSLPWSLEFGAGRGAFLYVSAQKQQKDGTIRAEIHLNGSLLQQAESDSAYGIASVNGMVARF